MRQAIVDAKTDFSLTKGTFQVPTDWKQDLQDQLMTSLAAQGYNGFVIFPTDGNAANGIVSQLAARNFPVMAVGGCVAEPTKTTYCIATDVGNSAYTGAKAAIAAMGGKGLLLHGTGLLTDPNTVLRVAAVKKAVAETNGAILHRSRNAADQPRQDRDLRGRLQDADQGHRRHLQGQVPFLLMRQATTSSDSLKTPIRRVDSYLVDLIPERPRTDAIQSFTKQETIFVGIETSDGVVGTC